MVASRVTRVLSFSPRVLLCLLPGSRSRLPSPSLLLPARPPQMTAINGACDGRPTAERAHLPAAALLIGPGGCSSRSSQPQSGRHSWGRGAALAAHESRHVVLPATLSSPPVAAALAGLSSWALA